MPFTSEERGKISEALRQRGIPEQCHLCQQGQIRLPDYVAFVPVYEPNVPGGKIEFGMFPAGNLPCLVLVCNNCGNTYSLNLKVLELWDELGLEEARMKEAVQ